MRIFTFATLLTVLTVSSAYCAEPLQLEPKLVFRLPLRASQPTASSAKRPSKLQGIGHFKVKQRGEEGDTRYYYGEMLCTDALGRVYFYDPINPKLALLRCIDREGYEIEQWKLRTTDSIYKAVSTADGYIWLGVNEAGTEKNNFPIVVYKFGQSTPVLDWRLKPPFDTDQFVQQTLGKKYFDALSDYEKLDATRWRAEILGTSQGKVQIELTNGGTGYSPDAQPDDKNYAITMRWTLTSDGKRTLQRDIYKSPVIRMFQQLASDGTQWYFTDDFSFKTRKWSKAWLWKKGVKKEQPLLTFEELTIPEGWWQKTYAFDKRHLIPPGFRVGGRGNAYLSFWRESKTARDGERAVAILNAKREVIGYIPWTPYESYIEPWIFPLPDGSGFYRQEKDDKELRIYFYALPKAK